ncbi:MAG: energy-coupling factor transporter transmembrane component T family protein [Candidatus Ranarchaeia archaeon]|jgi:energy-coupling factor transport system permease protein
MEENPLGLAYLRDRTSPLHRASPISKVAWFGVETVLALFIISDYTHLLINLGYVLIMCLFTRVDFKNFMKPMIILFPVWIPFLVVTPIAFTFQAGIIGLPPADRLWFSLIHDILVSIGIPWFPVIPYSYIGWRYGTSIFLRGTAVCAASLIIIWTTAPKDIVYSLTHNFRIPYRISWAVFLALIYTPIVSYEATVVDYAGKIRGVKYPRYPAGKQLKKVTPILVRSLRRAGITAIAMDGRAFGASPTRTFRSKPPGGKGSIVFAIASVAVGLLYTLFFWEGQLGQFSPWETEIIIRLLLSVFR